MNFIEKSILKYIENRHTVSDIDLFIHGLRVCTSNMILFILCSVLNYMLNNYINFLLFIFPFMLLRKYTGGIHLNKSSTCFIISIAFMTFIPYVEKFINLTLIKCLILSFMSAFVLVLISPVESTNKQLSLAERAYYKKKSIFYIAFRLLTKWYL